MSFSFTDNTSEAKRDAMQRASLGLRFILDDIEETSRPHTPKRKGDLRNQTLKQVLGQHASIAWIRAYAAAQEAGRMNVREARPVQLSNGDWITLKPGVHTFKKYSTAGTGPHFAENAVTEVVKRAEKHFKKAGL